VFTLVSSNVSEVYQLNERYFLWLLPQIKHYAIQF